jgi:hypothetical protein
VKAQAQQDDVAQFNEATAMVAPIKRTWKATNASDKGTNCFMTGVSWGQAGNTQIDLMSV